MPIYVNIAILGVTGLFLLIFLSLGVFQTHIALMLAIFSYVVFVFIALVNTRTWMEKEHNRKIRYLREKYEHKIRRLKKDHDTAMLEKTIRDGTRTLIKNAVDYFKIENIKKEMPPSAAIQNLQLDKYGQIIELLADFSLILPDYEENRQIVLQEITHQIDIFQIDEKDFADFLRTIMGKYLLTLKKKMREKMQQFPDAVRKTISCPECLSKIPAKAKVCSRCGYALKPLKPVVLTVLPSTKVPSEKVPAEPPVKKNGVESLQEDIRKLSMTIERFPNAPGAWYSRGMIYKKTGETGKAVEDLEMADRLGHERAGQVLKILKLSPDKA